MDKPEPDTSFLDNYQIFLLGENIQTSNYITRAIIKLSGDISPFMTHLSRVIENCGYNPGSRALAFRYQDMSTVVIPDTITISGMRDKQSAALFLEWLKEMIKTTD